MRGWAGGIQTCAESRAQCGVDATRSVHKLVQACHAPMGVMACRAVLWLRSSAPLMMATSSAPHGEAGEQQESSSLWAAPTGRHSWSRRGPMAGSCVERPQPGCSSFTVCMSCRLPQASRAPTWRQLAPKLPLRVDVHQRLELRPPAWERGRHSVWLGAAIYMYAAAGWPAAGVSCRTALLPTSGPVRHAPLPPLLSSAPPEERRVSVPQHQVQHPADRVGDGRGQDHEELRQRWVEAGKRLGVLGSRRRRLEAHMWDAAAWAFTRISASACPLPWKRHSSPP